MTATDDLKKLAAQVIEDAHEARSALVLARTERERRFLLQHIDTELNYARTVTRHAIREDEDNVTFIYEVSVDCREVLLGLIEDIWPPTAVGQILNRTNDVWWPTQSGAFARMPLTDWIANAAGQPVPWRQHCMTGNLVLHVREFNDADVTRKTAWEHLNDDAA